MAGCGYVCPQCEGKGFTEMGEECDYCKINVLPEKPDKKEEDKAEWIRNVHEGPCCSDPGKE